MKRLIWLVLILLTQTGCNEMGAIDKYFQELSRIDTASEEREIFIKINEFSSDNQYPYVLEVKNRDTNAHVDIADIPSDESEKLTVTITFEDGKYSREWNLIDNKNVFVLLRE